MSQVMSKWTDESGNPIPECSIHALQRHLNLLDKEYDLNIMIGFELEVIFLRRTFTSQPSYSPLTTTHSWGTFHPQDLTLALPLLTEIESALSAAGITVQQFHSEAGPGQYEIVLAPLPAIDAIHTLYQARQIVQHVAEAANLRATFHPCPVAGVGNASHAHISLNDTKLVSNGLGGRTEAEMDSLEMYFWAGVLEHLEAICAFSMPEAESYERVVEDHWTGGVWVAWGTQNREVPLRRIGGAGGSRRWEVRCVDGCANMYLAMAAIVAAGYEGLQERKDMRFSDCDVNPASVSEDVRASYGISRKLPGSVWEALKNLGEDERLREMIGVIADDYIVMKNVEQNMLAEMASSERSAWLVERY
jgi:glutamine synthetase